MPVKTTTVRKNVTIERPAKAGKFQGRGVQHRHSASLTVGKDIKIPTVINTINKKNLRGA